MPDGLCSVQISQQKVRKWAARPGDRSKSTAPGELRGEVAVEVENATRISVGARLNGSQIGDLRAKLDLMISVQPVEAVGDLVEIVEITDQASRGAEAGEACEVRSPERRWGPQCP